jgi:hypothetical protein
VRELIAIDGAGASEILLIDSLGCPTDVLIMGPMGHVNTNGQSLEAPFDAFKFPTSEIVQFKALVTPCIPSCQPVKCTYSSAEGLERSSSSFGRRKRESGVEEKVDGNQDELMVMQSIAVSDKFGFSRHQRKLDDRKRMRDPNNPNRHVFVETQFDDGMLT